MTLILSEWLSFHQSLLFNRLLMLHTRSRKHPTPTKCFWGGGRRQSGGGIILTLSLISMVSISGKLKWHCQSFKIYETSGKMSETTISMSPHVLQISQFVHWKNIVLFIRQKMTLKIILMKEKTVFSQLQNMQALFKFKYSKPNLHWKIIIILNIFGQLIFFKSAEHLHVHSCVHNPSYKAARDMVWLGVRHWLTLTPIEPYIRIIAVWITSTCCWLDFALP